MGLMYWQINDIWQAPTWSTIEYNLKWKMAHYYVREMYSPLYLMTFLKPYKANISDEKAKISISLANDYLELRRGQLKCSILTCNSFSDRLAFIREISLDASTIESIYELNYHSLIKRADCFNPDACLMHCSYQDDEDDQLIEQTLFFVEPKMYQLQDPELVIETVEKLIATEWQITLRASKPALFVWLEVGNDFNGYFSQNGFHMFQPVKVIKFYSWTARFDDPDFQLMSLFDVIKS